MRSAANPEKIGRRKTADNKSVIFWANNTITDGMGFLPKGSNGKVPEGVRNWLMGDVTLYDWKELGAVIKRARQLYKKKPSALPGDYRKFVSQHLP